MRVTINLERLENKCFVIMPFDAKFDLLHEEVFRPAIEEVGLVALRADEIYGSKRIMQDIWDSIRSSRFVLAELSGRNPNVLYELGLCHALGKPVLIVTSSMDDVPFDLKDLRCIVYEKDHPRWGDALRKNIAESLRAALSDQQKHTLFDDISVEGDYPALPKAPRYAPKVHIRPIITGEWQARESWPGLKVERETRFYLTQDGENVTGVALTQRYDPNSPTSTIIVKQTVSGRANSDTLNLVATSYEIVSGIEKLWSLESWQGAIDKDGSTIRGTVSDKNRKGKFEMHRTQDTQ